MKYLEIKDNKGFYLKGEDMVEIDKVNKDDLLVLLDRALEADFEMDEYVEANLKNKAHQIVYQNIHTKLSELMSDKEQFNKQVEGMYSEAIGEYGADVESEAIDEADVETQPDSTEEEINPEDIPF